MAVGTGGSGAELIMTSVFQALVSFSLPTFDEREGLGRTEFPVTLKSGIGDGGEQKVKRTLESEVSVSERG